MKWFWTKKGVEKASEFIKDAQPLEESQGVPEFDPTGLAVNAFTKDPKVKLTIAAIQFAWKNRVKELKILKKIKDYFRWFSFEDLLIAIVFIAVIVGVILTLSNCATICKP